MMLSKKPIEYRKWTIVLIAIAIILRFSLALIYTVSGDACWHLSAARFISEEGKLPLFEPIGRDEPFWAPPLFHVIAALFYSVLGNFGLKLVSPLFGSLCLVVGYAILKKRLRERATFYGMLFFSFLPIMIDYSVLGYGEAVLTFFVLLSLYLALEQRFLLAGIAAGLAILSKYNGGFVLPALLWIAWSSKEKWKNAFLVSVLPMAVAAPWLVRNFMMLGNPIWPFLNFMFEGAAQKAYSGINLMALWSLHTWQSLYLGFFGVPDGNMGSLALVSLPWFSIMFWIFLLGTLLFAVPLFFGWKKSRKDVPLYILLAGFVALFLLYVVNVGPFVSRMLMPSLIVLAIIYGRGMEKLIGWIGKERMMIAATAMLCTGFVLAIGIKFLVATHAWSFYKEDFDWVKSNTPKDTIFLAGGQCVPFHLERSSLPKTEVGKNIYSYAWLNDGFLLDKHSILSGDRTLLEKEGFGKMYENKRTGTVILGR